MSRRKRIFEALKARCVSAEEAHAYLGSGVSLAEELTAVVMGVLRAEQPTMPRVDLGDEGSPDEAEAAVIEAMIEADAETPDDDDAEDTTS